MKHLTLTFAILILNIINVFAINTIANNGCDVIALKSGKTLEVSIVSFSDHEIYYTLCESNDNDEYAIDRSAVESININENNLTSFVDEEVDGRSNKKWYQRAIAFLVGSIGVVGTIAVSAISAFITAGTILVSIFAAWAGF